jgi:hypothetical protein
MREKVLHAWARAPLTFSYRRLQKLVSSVFIVYVKFYRVEHYAVKWLLQCGGTHGQLE